MFDVTAVFPAQPDLQRARQAALRAHRLGRGPFLSTQPAKALPFPRVQAVRIDRGTADIDEPHLPGDHGSVPIGLRYEDGNPARSDSPDSRLHAILIGPLTGDEGTNSTATSAGIHACRSTGDGHALPAAQRPKSFENSPFFFFGSSALVSCSSGWRSPSCALSAGEAAGSGSVTGGCSDPVSGAGREESESRS